MGRFFNKNGITGGRGKRVLEDSLFQKGNQITFDSAPPDTWTPDVALLDMAKIRSRSEQQDFFPLFAAQILKIRIQSKHFLGKTDRAFQLIRIFQDRDHIHYLIALLSIKFRIRFELSAGFSPAIGTPAFIAPGVKITNDMFAF